jgi:hypothetical protein
MRIAVCGQTSAHFAQSMQMSGSQIGIHTVERPAYPGAYVPWAFGSSLEALDEQWQEWVDRVRNQLIDTWRRPLPDAGVDYRRRRRLAPTSPFAGRVGDHAPPWMLSTEPQVARHGERRSGKLRVMVAATSPCRGRGPREPRSSAGRVEWSCT